MTGQDETTVALPDGPALTPSSALPSDEPVPAVGDVIGRYRIEETIGQGGMGIVYAAWDPQLDRRVALKLLRAERGSADGMERERMLAEAQALARLAHPNVVEIFDVGLLRSGLFIAMELIEGRTLKDWLSSAGSWQEVLAVFDQAGRGLAAAHAAGVLHRDFKPSNVLVGPGKRVRVVDFGLATVFGGDTQPITDDSALGPVGYGSSSSRVIAGTPTYMAPEQWRGDVTDARSDQYAFCVALYHALYHALPFGPRPKLAPGEDAGPRRPRQPPRGSPVPRRVWSAVARGLAHAPAQRHPSMTALLEALAPPRSRTALVASVVVVGVAAIGVGWPLYEPPTLDPCARGRERLQAAWDAPTRQRVHEALVAADPRRGDQTALRVEQLLDEHATSWQAVHEEVCAATEATADHDLQVTCLDEGLAALQSTVAVLASADAAVGARAIEAAKALDDPRRCTEVVAQGGALAPPDPAVADAVAAARQRLAAARAQQHAGRFEAARAEFDAVAAEAEVLGYGPLRVEAWNDQGNNADERGDWKTAEGLLERAATEARALGHDRVLADASTQLVFVVGSELGRTEDGLAWSRHAEAAIERLGPEPGRRAQLAGYLGTLLEHARQLPEARAQLERALALRIELLGEDSPEVANTLESLGIVCYRQGERALGLEYLERAFAAVEQSMGPEHDRVAIFGSNLGAVQADQGNYAEARVLLEASLAIWEHNGGLRHPTAASTVRTLGIVYEAQGDLDAALATFERARDLTLALAGPEHVDYGNALLSLGVIHRTRGSLREARSFMEAAIVVLETAVGDTHPDTANAIANLASLLTAEGDHAGALQRYARALAVLEARLGPDHPLLVDVLLGQGESLLALGRVEDAIAGLERAVALAERGGLDPKTVANARLALAKARERAPERPGALASPSPP